MTDTASDIPELFRVSTKAVIVKGDRVLLLRTSAGNWDLPGGRLEPNEDVETSLKRELLEELGIYLPIGPAIYCGVRRRDPPKDNVVVVAHFCVMDTEINHIVLSDEHDRAHLFAADEIDELNMVESYRMAVQRGLERVFTEGSI